LLNKFGFNQIDITGYLSFLSTFFDRLLLSPIYFYIVTILLFINFIKGFSCCMWFIDKYWVFSLIMLNIALCFCFIGSFQKYRSLRKVFNYLNFYNVLVKRSFVTIAIINTRKLILKMIIKDWKELLELTPNTWSQEIYFKLLRIMSYHVMLFY